MIINGKTQSQKLKEKIRKEIISLKRKTKKTPKLSVILIGNYLPSQIYVRNKEKMAKEVGIKSEIIRYPSNISEKKIVGKINQLNKNKNVSGILVQLPLPKHIRKERIINSIDPKKDVDGFNPYNVGRLSSGYDAIAPCTPMGCLMLIKEVEKKLSGKHVVIIGRSNLNGKPMAQLMLRENCTVTIVHSKTKNIKQECLKAEILIAAAGVPKLVKEDWIQKNCIVIDVGINKLDGKIVGDTDYDNIKNHVKAITPVPGGVGPMTIACLLQNTLACFKKSNY